MSWLWRWSPLLLAAVAVLVVVYERTQLNDLQEQVEALANAEAPAREIVRERVVQAAAPEPVVIEPPPVVTAPPDDSSARLEALTERLETMERRVSLAMTILDGVTAQDAGEETPTNQSLAAELAAIRDELDALHADNAEARATADAAAELAAAQPPPEPPPTLGERWRNLRDARDQTLMNGLAEAANLEAPQAQQLQAIIGQLRDRQEATLQQVWRGEKSLTDAQIELDELERQTVRQFRRTLNGSQERALQHNLTTYPRPGWSY
ncbi:MAG: hypothetical protein H6744_21220 [Deltaproteobacteria bacterium]|nr:hypothetical protein [Deltaproteobacteria bacterium]